MRLISNILKDVALRNITIYAQWLGIATAIVVLWTQVSERHLYEKQSWNSLHTWGVINEIWMLILYPICPLAMEVPLLFKLVPIGRYILVPWWLALSTRWRDRIVSNGARVGFYLGYALTCSLYVGNDYYRRVPGTSIWLPVYQMNVACVLSIVTACLYFLACVVGHKYVFGRTLGGSGVKPMDLTLPGPGPQYPAVSQEGRIRLV